MEEKAAPEEAQAEPAPEQDEPKVRTIPKSVMCNANGLQVPEEERAAPEETQAKPAPEKDEFEVRIIQNPVMF